MPTTAQRQYPTAGVDDQAFSGEATIRKLADVTPAANATTTVTWTTTTVTEKTIIPLTANQAAGNTSQNSGWAFNNGGADGLGSTATAQRWIRAGTWTFGVQATLNTPALLDTHAATVTAFVYRVPAGGGARTLLFSATSANFTATGNLTWTGTQPEYVLGAGEVLMVGYTATSASTTALVLGANTNTVLTVTLGANTFVNLPAPNIGTLSIGAGSSNGSATADAIGASRFAAAGASAGAATIQGVASAVGSGVGSSAGVATANAVGASRGAFAGAAAGIAQAQGILTSIFSGAGLSVGAANATGVASAIFSGKGQSDGAATVDGRITNLFSGVGESAGAATVEGKASSVAGTIGNSQGQANVTGRLSAVLGTTGTVEIGVGGGETINQIRPQFIFDD